MKRVALLLIGIAVVSTICAVFTSATSSSLSLKLGGPLNGNGDSAYVVPLKVGSRFTDGFNALDLRGTLPARVLAIESEQTGDSFSYLGALVAGPQRKYGEEEVLPGYPPRGGSLGPLVAASGLRILPMKMSPRGFGYELLLGYKETGTERTYRDQIVVIYQVGPTVYIQTFHSHIVGCPPGQSKDVCLKSVDLSSSEND